MKKKYSLTFLIFLCFIGIGFGQIIAWDFTSGNTANTNLPGGIAQLSNNTSGTLGTAGCTGNGYSVNNWNVNEYFQIEVSTLNYNFTTVTFNARSSNTGP